MIRSVVLVNGPLRKEQTITIVFITNLVQTNTGGIVYMIDGQRYVVDKKEYAQLKEALLSWNREVWQHDTLIEIPEVTLQ